MPKPLDPNECATLIGSDRWQSKVGLDDSGCIVWMATRTHAGYGAVRLSNGMARVHRVAWVAAEGKDVPDGLTIDHLCRNRACVNPEHLEAVTQQENTLRGETLPAAQVLRVQYEDYTYATPLTVSAMTDGRHISCIEAGDDPDCDIGNCPEPICWVCGEIWPCDKAGEQ